MGRKTNRGKVGRHHGVIEAVVHGGVDNVHGDREYDSRIVLRRDAVQCLQISQLKIATFGKHLPIKSANVMCNLF